MRGTGLSWNPRLLGRLKHQDASYPSSTILLCPPPRPPSQRPHIVCLDASFTSTTAAIYSIVASPANNSTFLSDPRLCLAWCADRQCRTSKEPLYHSTRDKVNQCRSAFPNLALEEIKTGPAQNAHTPLRLVVVDDTQRDPLFSVFYKRRRMPAGLDASTSILFHNELYSTFFFTDCRRALGRLLKQLPSEEETNHIYIFWALLAWLFTIIILFRQREIYLEKKRQRRDRLTKLGREHSRYYLLGISPR